MRELLISGFAELGLALPPEVLEQYETYYTLLDESNRVMNLTAITGPEDTARLHFLDCAALLKAVEFQGKRVIDVGSGAGFPGLPLKLAEPSLRLTMLDSQAKRVRFLQQVIGALGLTGAETVLGRAEEAPKLREQFDVATARAVAELSVLAELCMPFVEVGGRFLAMKGPEPEAELEAALPAIRALGGETEKVVPYTIPGTEVVHTAVVIRKTAPTPGKYPRRWAKIQKEPIRG